MEKVTHAKVLQEGIFGVADKPQRVSQRIKRRMKGSKVKEIMGVRCNWNFIRAKFSWMEHKGMSILV